MTNLGSIGGSLVWAAMAGILMLMTFEPVSTETAIPNAPSYILM